MKKHEQFLKSDEEQKLGEKLSFLFAKQQSIRYYRDCIMSLGTDEEKQQHWSDWYKAKRAVQLVRIKMRKAKQRRLAKFENQTN
ncbi:hypothetical protein [Vibrio harveyi]|uniref:hypothetical protein n=1 Tax=Vibrio harveyi TaxID=669 RepID=UPI00075C6C30|nr:hypothetical protein [Vibrio harveyi]PNM43643.1 hypothetical protein AL469_027730 [Vibrio harveyi]